MGVWCIGVFPAKKPVNLSEYIFLDSLFGSAASFPFVSPVLEIYTYFSLLPSVNARNVYKLVP